MTGEAALIHPENRYKKVWDDYILVMTIAASIGIPLRLALNYQVTGWVLALDVLIIGSFLTDLVLNFFTAVYEGGQLVTSLKRIAILYLRTWFIVDFLAGFPFDLIIPGALATLTDTFRVVRLVRLLRLARVAQFMRRFGRANIVNVNVLRMVFLLFWVLLLCHWAACGWIVIGGGNIAREDMADPIRAYVRSLYWAVTTITTIGFGDITPISTGQTIYVILLEFMGAGVYGYAIGTVASLLANLDVARAQYLDKLERINAFMRFRRIPDDIQENIRSYYEYLWESRRGYDEAQVVEDLPSSLKLKVALYLSKDILEKVPLFRGAGDDLLQQIAMSLHPRVFTPSAFVFRKGEVGHNMYFISRGSVEVVGDDGQTLATLTAGNFFGEIALLLSMPRTATIRAVDYCDLYTLDKDTFQQIIRDYPEFAERVREMARARQSEADKKDAIVVRHQTPPDPPADVRAEALPGNAGVRISWTAAPEAAVYQLVRYDPASNRWHMLNGFIRGTDFRDDRAAILGQTPYRVRAANEAGVSPWSSAAIAG